MWHRAWMTAWWRIGYCAMQENNLTAAYVKRGGRNLWSVP